MIPYIEKDGNNIAIVEEMSKWDSKVVMLSDAKNSVVIMICSYLNTYTYK